MSFSDLSRWPNREPASFLRASSSSSTAKISSNFFSPCSKGATSSLCAVPAIERRVRLAHHFEDRGLCLSGIEIVFHGRLHRLEGFVSKSVHLRV